MKRMFFCLVFLNVFSSLAISEDEVRQETLVKPSFHLVKDEDLVWNKWDTENFVILSIDKNQGLFLKDKIEDIKVKVCENFNLKNNSFPIKCKILCVPDNSSLKKLFSVDRSVYEVRYEEDKPIVSAIWISFEDLDLLDSFIYATCVSSGFSDKNYKLFVQKGVFKILKEDPNMLKQNISKVQEISSDKVFNTTQTEWADFSSEEKENFENQSVVLCLLFRKEFGKNIFGKFLNSSQTEDSLKSVYGFDNFSVFDSTLVRYLKNIKQDIENKKTPNEYLKIK